MNRKKMVRRNGLYKRGGTYWLRKQIGGVMYQVPLLVGPRDDAREVYNQVLKEIAMGLHGLKQAPTLSATIEGWCRLHRKQESHVQCARWVEKVLGPMTGMPLTSITTQRVEAWVSDFIEGHKPATVNMAIRYLKLWMRWAIRRKEILGMPFDVAPIKVERRPRPVVKISQQDVFLDAVDIWMVKKDGTPCYAEPQVRAAIRMMLGLGMREAEVIGARWEWLDQEAKTYTIGKAKGMKPRVLGVPDWVMEHLDELPRTVSGLIFPGEKGREHPHGWLRKALNRGARAVPDIVGTLGNHRLRASFATRHAEVGTPLSAIKDMMGHESVVTTMGYIEDNLDIQKEAQKRLSAALRKGG